MVPLQAPASRGVSEFSNQYGCITSDTPLAIIGAMSLAMPEDRGPLRRERLRTARLYFVCEALPGGRDPEPLLQAALSGGADIVQLREKELAREEIERSARTFRRLCDTYSALFVVNDDPYLAKTCDADGVHVGQDDMPAAEAREILGPEAIVGLSTHSEQQLAASTGEPVDYVSVGPIWETPTKEGRPGVGLGLVEHAAAHAPHPFFAIGGIDPGNAAEVVAAGARRLGAVRAIRDAGDPAAASAALRAALAPIGEAAPGA
jgi:thiamine-phosphate pyrophosphorylase